MFIIIVFWLGSDRPSGFFFLARFTSFHTHASLLTSSSVYLISFLLFPCASVWENARAWVAISYSRTEWYLLFFAKRRDRNGRRVACQKLTIIIIIIIIIIYHDFLPTPRRGSHVKSGKTHTQSSRYTP